MPKKKTQTSSFGTTGRSNHDASQFYQSKLYDSWRQPILVGKEEHELPANYANQIFAHSSETMHELPDSSVHLMITSPPYNATKAYDENLTLEDYLTILQSVFQETYRVLVNGGRACVNVANLGRKPYIPLSHYISHIMQDIGFRMRGEIIWNKAASAGTSTAWGSWQSASNPTLRDVHEYILVFSKGEFKRSRSKIGEEKQRDTIKKEDFLEWTKSVWTFPSVSAKKIGHPAPFPLELPRRLIQLYSFTTDVVLDPFIGSGTTAIAALEAERRYVGYETQPEYVQLAQERIQNVVASNLL